MAATTANLNTEAVPSHSNAARWTGRVLSGFSILFLSFDAAMKIIEHPMVVQGSAELGWPPGVMFGIGVVLACCVALYAIPRTAILGAVLLTGYLGGAIATHVRVQH